MRTEKGLKFCRATLHFKQKLNLGLRKYCGKAQRRTKIKTNLNITS